MKISSREVKNHKTQHFFGRATASAFHGPKQTNYSLQSHHLRSHNALTIQDKPENKHRRVVSFATTNSKQSISPFLTTSKINQQNKYHRTYRYRSSRNTGLNIESRMIGGRMSGRTKESETQKQKFIRLLKDNVIESHQNSFVENYQIQEEGINYIYPSKEKNQRARSSNSVVEIDLGEKEHIQKQNNFVSATKLKTMGNQHQSNDGNRSRAKTFAKDFSKIVEENLHLRPEGTSDYSKTITLNPFDNSNQASRSLDQIENIEKIRISPPHHHHDKQTPEKGQDVSSETVKVSAQEISASSRSSADEINTVVYEEQVEQLTNDFFSDWQKMNSSRSELYEKLRSKLVTQYPSMRKKYNNYEIPTQSPRKFSKASQQMSSAFQSSLRISYMNMKSQSDEPNYLTVTQLRQKVVGNEDQKLKKTLRQIFKQAYFWSKTRRRYFNTKYDKVNQQQIAEQKQIRNIQKNMTFLSYMGKKNWKKTLNKGKIKGAYIVKHKESILKLEKEGSQQQNMLKKCLDEAIESCIRSSM